MIEKVIKRRSGLIGIDFKELWNYRDLLGILGWRDVLVSYKQMSVGFIWAFVRPFLTMVVFTIIFSNIAKLPSSGVPYPVLIFAGLLPWQLCSTSLSSISNSVVSSGGIISKIYFPRLILPVSAIISGFIDFLISSAILVGLMAWYHILPSPAVLLLPLFLLLTLCFSLGVGLWFSAINVEYRDVRYVIPFLLQLGTYISPVAYATNVVPEKWRLLYSLNPMVGAIDGFRWAILGQNFVPNWMGVFISSITVLVILISGALYFRKMEKTFADNI